MYALYAYFINSSHNINNCKSNNTYNFLLLFFKGDLSNYNSFLNCYEVNKEKFIQDFNNVYDLYNSCILYIALQSIYISFDIFCYIFILDINK